MTTGMCPAESRAAIITMQRALGLLGRFVDIAGVIGTQLNKVGSCYLCAVVMSWGPTQGPQSADFDMCVCACGARGVVSAVS